MPPTLRRVLTPLLLLAITAPLALALGCSELNSLGEAYDFDSCETATGNAAVEGSWVIVGTGQLYGCGSETLDGDIQIQSQVLFVTQTPKGGDSTADSIQLPEPLGVASGEFSLNGEVAGSCVNFETRETRQGGAIVYRFIGKASESSDAVTGTFTVNGPGSCSGDGSFSIEVR